MARSRGLLCSLLLATFLIAPTQGHAQTTSHTAPPTQASQVSQTTVSASSAVFELQGEALAWLQGLVRINTSNPPGNELVAAKYIAAAFSSLACPPVPFPILPAPCC